MGNLTLHLLEKRIICSDEKFDRFLHGSELWLHQLERINDIGIHVHGFAFPIQIILVHISWYGVSSVSLYTELVVRFCMYIKRIPSWEFNVTFDQ